MFTSRGRNVDFVTVRKMFENVPQLCLYLQTKIALVKTLKLQIE